MQSVNINAHSTNADIEKTIANFVESGEFRPVGRDVQHAVKLIKRELLEPLGLKPPELPIYYISPWLMSPDTSATTKFSHDEKPHYKRPLMIGINTLTLMTYDFAELVATLAHELVHASIPFDADPITGPMAGHGPVFQHYNEAIGLEGDPRMNHAGPWFRNWVETRVKPSLDGIATQPYMPPLYGNPQLSAYAAGMHTKKTKETKEKDTM
jgi:hypothetical protein